MQLWRGSDALSYSPILLLLVIQLLFYHSVKGLHLTGTFNNHDFFQFLAKFGFQKVDKNDKPGTTGYIYGRITAKNFNITSVNHDMYLVVVDSQYFVQYYAQSEKDIPRRCTNMFSKIDQIAWDSYCVRNGVEDFLRRIPCPADSYCLEELGNLSAVLADQQFTYRIIDLNQPRFWYISLVACSRLRDAKHCQWTYNSSLDLKVEYDIWFVNGNPDYKQLNPFEHQFSFELHDVFEIYLALLVLNGFLLLVQIWAFKQYSHLLIWLLTGILALKVTGIFFNLVHISVFALNGEGVNALRIMGNVIDVCTQSAMMLELLYIAKGWTVTSKQLQGKFLLHAIWAAYTVVNIVLYIFMLLAADPIRDLDEWQTTPSYFVLVFRCAIMFYFLYELQNSFAREDSDYKRKLYTKFGAACLVWFIYLPILALVSPKIAALWRFKCLLSIQLGADFIFVSILVHLFWPGGEVIYFDIPKRSRPSATPDADRAVLDDESSEDELFERQASVRLKSTHSNGVSDNRPSYFSIDPQSDENTCL